LDFFLNHDCHFLFSVASAWDNHKLVSMLLNSGTESLDFREWKAKMWTDYEDRLEMVLEHISKKAPNLQKLIIGGKVDNDVVQRPFLKFMQPMVSLQHLAITTTWGWHDYDLKLLVEKFPNLVSLKVERKDF